MNVWDGTSDKLKKGFSVLVGNNLIKQVGKNISAPDNARIIDGGRKTLIPGLSDAHVHLSATMGGGVLRNDTHWMYSAIRTAQSC